MQLAVCKRIVFQSGAGCITGIWDIKTPHKSFMLLIEEWVLVTNPYAVGYHSSALFLVLHNEAICLHNTCIFNYTIAFASKGKCWTLLSLSLAIWK